MAPSMTNVGPMAPGAGEPPWFVWARGELGVMTIPGPEADARILGYFSHTTYHTTRDETPWCSAFVCAGLERNGIRSTRSAAAKSWIAWGVGLDAPRVGAILVLRNRSLVKAKPDGREDTASGYHVTFEAAGALLGFDGSERRSVLTLGGNQSKTACFKAYALPPWGGWEIVARRWPA